VPQYTFHRASIVIETFRVTATDEATARQQLESDPEPCKMMQEWLDWYEDDYELADVRDELELWLRAGIEEKAL
jgi:hypothetical protein